MFFSANLRRISSRSTLQLVRQLHSTDSAQGIKSRWVAPTLKAIAGRNQHMKNKRIEPVYVRSEFVEWNYNAELYAFGKRLDEEFSIDLLREALSDISYIEDERVRHAEMGEVEESSDFTLQSNDSLLQIGYHRLMTHIPAFIQTAYPYLPHEGITAVTKYLTSEAVLANIGLGLGLKDLIMCSKLSHPSPDIIARCVTAVLGALEKTSGLKRTNKFVNDFFITQLVGKDISDIWKVENPLDVVQDITSRSGLSALEPRLIGHAGQKTICAVYHIGLYLEKQIVGTGYGETVQVAVNQAAEDVLKRIFGTTLWSDPMPIGQAAPTELSSGSRLFLQDVKFNNIVSVNE